MVCIGIESQWRRACHAAAKRRREAREPIGRQPTVTGADVRRRGTMPLLFQNFLCSLFLFAIPQKKKKRDISFKNEEGQKENARSRLHLRKVVSMHGNIGGIDAHGIRNTVTYLRACHAVAKRQPTTCLRALPA